MKRNKLFYLSALLLFASTLIYSQNGDIFSPFPSSLRISPRANGIQLTWRDSPDVFESYEIYRYTEEITEENFHLAEKAGQVPPGTSTFTDYPGDEQTYFYAVLLNNPDGGLYELFIPFRNKSVVGAAATQIKNEEEIAAEITRIGSSVSGDSIQVSYKSNRGDRTLLIYRHTDPIASVDNLLEASRIAVVQSDTGSYTDYPIPGIQYYYGVFDSKLLQTGTFSFNPGENITTSPVKISATSERPGLAAPAISLRSPPLPNLIIQKGIESGKPLTASLALIAPSRKEVNPETEIAIQGLLSLLPEQKLIEPQPAVLPQHIHGGLEGAAYTLGLILKEQFLKEDYKAASESLANFLSIRRTPQIETAARFYYGQALYMNGEYNDAFYEFLVAEEEYYPESQVWINRIYRHLRS